MIKNFFPDLTAVVIGANGSRRSLDKILGPLLVAGNAPRQFHVIAKSGGSRCIAL